MIFFITLSQKILSDSSLLVDKTVILVIGSN